MGVSQTPVSDTASFSARLADWRASGERIAIGSHKLFVHRAGDWSDASRPLLTLIHGFPTASWDWHRVWPALSARFRLVALDLLGYGFSDKPTTHRYSIFEQADIVEGLWRSLGAAHSHVLAHDYGDTVTQELLARQIEPDAPARTRIGSAALLNGGIFPEAHRARLIQRLLASPIGALLARSMGRERFQRSFTRIFAVDKQPTPLELEEYWSLIASKQGHRISHLLIRYIDERKRHRDRWVGALVRSDVPVAFLVGMDDPVSGAHMGVRFRELVPQGFLAELPGVGHYPQVEAPDMVLHELDRFWRSVPIA